MPASNPTSEPAAGSSCPPSKPQGIDLSTGSSAADDPNLAALLEGLLGLAPAARSARFSALVELVGPSEASRLWMAVFSASDAPET